MIQLHFVVEGQTELIFVRDLLAYHLGNYDLVVDQRKVEFSRSKGKIYKGGLFDYKKLRGDIQRWLKEEKNRPNVRFTTMIDLYALPNNFPQFNEAQKISDPFKRVQFLEIAFQDDISDSRFIPYIQLHEFEAILFADVQQFDWEFLEHQSQIHQLQKIANEFKNPELINDGDSTAPSKRIIALIGEYEYRKSSAGPAIAKAIGINKIREKCSHFDQWLIKLEQLSQLP